MHEHGCVSRGNLRLQPDSNAIMRLTPAVVLSIEQAVMACNASGTSA